MANELTTKHYTLNELIKNELIKREDIKSTNEIILDKLNQGNITSILNAFLSNTLITDFGEIYFKINGLNKFLRTSNSGLERAYVYQGIPKLISPCEIINFNGEDYISRYELIKLLKYRSDHAPKGKTKLYLEIVIDIYNKVVRNPIFENLKRVFIEEVQEKRSALKNARIEQYQITRCEFNNNLIFDYNDYEFAHLDAVAYNPFLALNIDNGVIIHKNIHSDMTRRGLNTAQDIYNYCIEKKYSIKWSGV